jgi:hypothetical protein
MSSDSAVIRLARAVGPIGVEVGVCVAVDVGVAVSVGIGVAVCDAVGLGFTDGVDDAVAVGDDVGVAVGSGVSPPSPAQAASARHEAMAMQADGLRAAEVPLIWILPRHAAAA